MYLCSVCDSEVPRVVVSIPPTCSKCYRKSYKRKKRECFKCGKIRRVEKLDSNKKPICIRCYQQPQKICAKCNRLGEICKDSICRKCYMKEYVAPQKQCDVCGATKPVHAVKDNINFCSSCYDRPLKKCHVCSRINVMQKVKGGKNICQSCYRPPKSKCSRCDKIKYVKVIIDDLPVCSGCHIESYKMCSNCKRKRKVNSRTTDGLPLCQVCRKKYRMSVDENFHMLVMLRSAVYGAFKHYSTSGKIYSAKKYDIIYKDIINHLGPCPKDTKVYQIDHILPLSAFDFGNPIHIKAAFAPENHQWLEKEKNQKKGCRYSKNEFDQYIKKFK